MSDSLFITNARIWTADCSNPWAESIAVKNGRIAAIDDPETGQSCKNTLNCGGRFAMPGLIDTHTHLLMGGESLTQLDLSEVTSRNEFENAIAMRNTELEENDWLLAHGWSQDNWVDKKMPDKSWLKEAANRPTVAYRMDSHCCLVNDAVLSLCDLSADPEGGRIERDSKGNPTGVFYEAAAWKLINTIIPHSSVDIRMQALLQAQTHAHSLGLTTVGSMEYARQVEDVFLPLRNKLTLRTCLTLLDRELPIDFTFGETFADDEMLAVIGYKTFVDGTLGSRTARMLDDYSDSPGNRGLLCELAASNQLNTWINEVTKHGFQPAMHAIGVEAVRIALDAVDCIPRDKQDSVRARIEHAQHISPQDITRFSGKIANMQPLHKADDSRTVTQRVGKERLYGFFAFRKLINAGAKLAFGSDWPIVSLNPLLGVRAAVTGLTKDGIVFQQNQNLTVEEALHAYTIDAAYALRFEDVTGSIKTGKLGDITILDRDPFTCNWTTEIPKVEMTISSGRICYKSTSV